MRSRYVSCDYSELVVHYLLRMFSRSCVPRIDLELGDMEEVEMDNLDARSWAQKFGLPEETSAYWAEPRPQVPRYRVSEARKHHAHQLRKRMIRHLVAALACSAAVVVIGLLITAVVWISVVHSHIKSTTVAIPHQPIQADDMTTVTLAVLPDTTEPMTKPGTSTVATADIPPDTTPATVADTTATTTRDPFEDDFL